MVGGFAEEVEVLDYTALEGEDTDGDVFGHFLRVCLGVVVWWYGGVVVWLWVVVRKSELTNNLTVVFLWLVDSHTPTNPQSCHRP